MGTGWDGFLGDHWWLWSYGEICGVGVFGE
jgi:hypothetical protein